MNLKCVMKPSRVNKHAELSMEPQRPPHWPRSAPRGRQTLATPRLRSTQMIAFVFVCVSVRACVFLLEGVWCV